MNTTTTKDTVITIRLLKKLGACSDHIELFGRTFPGGRCELTAANIRIALAAKLDVEWFAKKVLPALAWKAYDEATALARKAYDEATALALIQAFGLVEESKS